MRLRKLFLAGGVAVLSIPVVVPTHSGVLMHAARADIYHATERDDTLSSVAARYGVAIETLRSLNKLQGTGDAATLPSMLLRVPDKSDASGAPRRVTLDTSASMNFAAPSRTEKSPASESSGSYGTVVRSTLYTVQTGDTLESIAQSQAREGYNVTAEAIRRKNNVSGALLPGSRLIIPQQSATYRAPQPAVTTFAPSDSASSSARRESHPAKATRVSTVGGEVEVSDEVWMPTAQEIPQKTPLYRTPNALPSPKRTAQRGPANLSSRGYFPNPNLEGARVLGQGEDAPVVGKTTPRSRVTGGSVLPGLSSPETLSPMARVAHVAVSGARIRRLPDAGAATLYHCATGTELAVTRRSGMWSAILMSDLSTGWVPSRYLKFTGASIDVSTQVVTGAAAAERRRAEFQGNSSSGRLAVGGQFSSDNPMVAQALKWIGTPYVYGGEGRRGIDCSSLVQHAFAACGYRLPRTAAEQSKIGMKVDPADLQPGDRLYFSASGSRVDHTGLYMGNGLFVHASGSGRAVIVSRLADRRNWNIFVWARR